MEKLEFLLNPYQDLNLNLDSRIVISLHSSVLP
ncbi:hypothetical protein SAMN05421820_10444 [Pedobacter steynii]|uniref:Uncharacterized protein n=1 Tax=Pedobacter steynii TaxID=430522 RepID=A0A1G9U2T3_9SPHI|nr:hypothetical protein SAMN05421820_10444 [Pedobacter steynii]